MELLYVYVCMHASAAVYLYIDTAYRYSIVHRMATHIYIHIPLLTEKLKCIYVCVTAKIQNMCQPDANLSLEIHSLPLKSGCSKEPLELQVSFSAFRWECSLTCLFFLPAACNGRLRPATCFPAASHLYKYFLLEKVTNWREKTAEVKINK